MEVPRQRVKSELYLLAYATSTATPDPSRICSLYHSSWQCWILNHWARPGIEPVSSWILVHIHFCWAMMETYHLFLKSWVYMTLLLRKAYICIFLLSKKVQRGFFAFIEKSWKVKIEFSVCFSVSELSGGNAYPKLQEWHCQAPSPWTTCSIPAATTLHSVCEHLCLISVYFVHPLAWCVLR